MAIGAHATSGQSTRCARRLSQIERHRRAFVAFDANAAARRQQACPGAEHAPALVGQQLLDAGGAGQEQIRQAHIALRRLAGAIFKASRYLATVRRATWMPCSASISAS